MRKFIYDHIGIVSILGMGLFLRLWGLTWALPLKKAHIDESVVIFYTMRFFSGDLNPHIFFDYPTLFLYLLGFVYFIYFLAGWAFEIFSSLDGFVGMFLNGDASSLYIIARSLSAAFGVASIYLVYKIGKENLSSGYIPAFIMAIIPVHVLHSHYATVDIACVFFVLLSVLFILRYYDNKNINDLYTGSFILGLGTAVKYYPAVFLLPVIYLILKNDRNAFLKRSFHSGLLLLSGFILGCPFSILDVTSFASRFIDRFKLIVWAPSSGVSFGILGLFSSSMHSTTVILFILLAAGVLLALKYATGEELKKYFFLLSFPVVYLLFLATWKIRSEHYILPALPFIVLAGAYGLEKAPFLHKKQFIAFILVFLFCMPAIKKDLNIDILLSKKDTRLVAYEWVKNNVPKGSRILRLPFTPEFTDKDPYYVKVDWYNKIINEPVNELAGSYDYIIMSGNDSEETTNILKEYKILNNWEHIPLAPFHNPRVTIYGKKS